MLFGVVKFCGMPGKQYLLGHIVATVKFVGEMMVQGCFLGFRMSCLVPAKGLLNEAGCVELLAN